MSNDASRKKALESLVKRWHASVEALAQREQWDAVLVALDHPPLGLLDPPAWRWSIRGRALEHLQRFEEALSSYNQAIAVSEPTMARLVDTARILINLHSYYEALRTLDQAMMCGSSHVTTEYTTGHIPSHSSSGEQVTLSEVWELTGYAQLDLGHAAEALIAFEHAVTLTPLNVSAWKGKGVALLTHNESARALAAFDQALQLDPSQATLWIGKGEALLDLNRLTQAIAAYTTAQEHGGLSATAQHNLGVAQFRLGRYVDALQSFEYVIAQDAIDHLQSRSLAMRGRVLARLHRDQDALHSYDQAIAVDAHNGHAWAGKFRLSLRYWRLRDAWHAGVRAFRLFMEDPEADRRIRSHLADQTLRR